MAVDVCSEISSLGASPRISFSHDLNQTENSGVTPPVVVRSDFSLLDSNSDFHFCICKSFELPSADELFSNGKILPTQIKKVVKTNQTQQPNSNSVPFQPTQIRKVIKTNQTQQPSSNENAIEDKPKKKRLKEYLSSNFDTEDEEEEAEKPMLKSFWQFRRSSSLNCDNRHTKSLIRSLQFLSRSNSTGSVPTVQKQRASTKENQKHQAPKQQSSSIGGAKSPPALNSAAFCSYNSSKKTPSGKNCRSYSNGVRISPVLNFPPTYISLGTMNLFGFGSLFCNGKSKKKKK
ncbi:uncharacterized protein LOC132302601 [Cornus florida]|uniref:uncharacterized protein LOC132302601 n=1 Tax=Cornus florida TaxID=4283 RepID=UPI00289AB009|nr:uncharacterized protein LOC132302601 [Cornus florida]